MTHAFRVLAVAALFTASLHADDVVGLWAAKRYFGPDLKGNLTIERGGQIVMAVPDLDLVIAFYRGNYSHPAIFTAQRVYVPQHVLPAVK